VPEVRLQRSALFAGVAEGIVATALPLLAANLTHDPLVVSAVIAAQHLPWIIVALVWPMLGASDRRTLVGTVHTMRALAVGVLGLLAVGGFESMHKIELVAFIVGLGEALTSSVEEEAGDDALTTRGMLGLALVGMPLGGFLYEIFLAVPFLLDVLFFALAALFALFVPRPVRTGGAQHLGAPRLAPGTGPVTITAVLATAAGSAVLGVLVLFALVDLGLGAPAFGILLAILAFSAAGGAWIAPEVGALLGVRVGVAAAALVAAGALVNAAHFADPGRPEIGAVCLAMAWAAATTTAVLLRALLPAAAGQPVAGRNLRAFHLAEWCAVVVGALAGGWLGRERGVADVLVWAAGAWILTAASVVIVRIADRTAPSSEVPASNWLDAA
jgi:hypothetical protein